MQTRLLRVLVFAVALLLPVLLNPRPFPVRAAPRAHVEGPFQGPLLTPVSLDALARARAPARLPADREMPAPLRRSPASGPDFSEVARPDRARQAAAALANMPPPIVSFEGLSHNDGGAGWPPDPNGDVGPNHYVQAVNISVAVFSKSGALLKATSFDGLFDGTGTPCDNDNQGDPIVLYDHLADRWVISDFAFANRGGPFYECVAVSKTSDPVAGGWWLYTLLADNVYLNDYPKLGLWPDGYYVSGNMFDLSTGQQVAARVWALDRQAMLNGQAFKPVYFNLPCDPNCVSTLLPSNLRGALPPAGSPNTIGSIDAPNVFHLWKFHVDWNAWANSTFTGPVNITVPDFVMPCFAALIFACVPELNGERVDALGDRLMMPLQYRNLNGVESLWANHTVAASSAVGAPTGIRWYEIRNLSTTPSLYQRGTFQPDDRYRWMGSLAVDGQGNMALGYSVSSAAMYPAIRYAGRAAADPPDLLTYGEASLMEGTGAQTGGTLRWGDYSAMTVDPVDDCTFWYTNEYYAVTGMDWHTRIGSFRFPSCGAAPPTPTPTPTATPTAVPSTLAPAPTATPGPVKCEDAYEPDDWPSLAHTITRPELHNFAVPGDVDWVKFPIAANWVYHIKADPPRNFPTEPRLELYVEGNLIASNDHYFGNIAEIWWWNNLGDGTAFVRVSELRGRGECGNSQYTLSVEGSRQAP